jgi:hypothetical protein
MPICALMGSEHDDLHHPGLLAGSDLPLLRTGTVDGLPLFYPRRLAKQLNRSGRLDRARARTIAVQLARRLPAA